MLTPVETLQKLNHCVDVVSAAASLLFLWPGNNVLTVYGFFTSHLHFNFIQVMSITGMPKNM